MSFAYMPFYTGDYYRDTRHLSMLQHGAYRQLIDHCWDQRGPLPLDLEKCYRICGAVNKEEQEAVKGIVKEFFVEMEDGHYNKRVTDEIRRCEAISGVRVAAGRTGGLAKAAAKNDAVKASLANAKQVLANAKQMPVSPSPSPSPASSPKNSEDSGLAQAPSPPPAYQGEKNESEIPAKAVVAISGSWELPTTWGQDAESLGFTPHEILRESERFRQYWVVGKGAGKRRGVKGWRQAWSNWLQKAETMKARA